MVVTVSHGQARRGVSAVTGDDEEERRRAGVFVRAFSSNRVTASHTK